MVGDTKFKKGFGYQLAGTFLFFRAAPSMSETLKAYIIKNSMALDNWRHTS